MADEQQNLPELYPMPAFEKALARGVASGMRSTVDAILELVAVLKSSRNALFEHSKQQPPPQPQQAPKSTATPLSLLERALRGTGKWRCADKHCGVCKGTPVESAELESACLRANLSTIQEYVDKLASVAAEQPQESQQKRVILRVKPKK